MRAAVLDNVGGPLHLRDVEDPKPGRGEVVVRIAACGVCFTDLKTIDGLATTFPLIPGHEPVGVVAEVGSDVLKIRVGDRVCVHSFFSCGHCSACADNEEEACVLGIAALAGVSRDGGYAEYMVVPAGHVVPLPDELTFAEAAPLLCAGLTTFAAFQNAGLRAGQRAAVIGVGGLGHLALSIGTALGADVYAITTSPDKAVDALARGAVFADSVDIVGARLADEGGAHVVINTVDALGSLERVIPAMAKQGSIVLAAGGGETLPVTPAQLGQQQLKLIGSFFGSTQDVRDLLTLCVEHRIRPQVERYAFDMVEEVHQRLRDNKIRYRAVLEF